MSDILKQALHGLRRDALRASRREKPEQGLLISIGMAEPEEAVEETDLEEEPSAELAEEAELMAEDESDDEETARKGRRSNLPW